MKPNLVILAAGIGSRYGGLKQMDGIGRKGQTLLDYSVFDALKAGFGKVIFIIKKDLEKDFEETVLKRFNNSFHYELAYQELDSLIPERYAAEAQTRKKPWGTAHALLCAAHLVDAPFAVINSDDFYGRAAYEILGAFLSKESNTGAIVPYNINETLSTQGTVTRGVCSLKEGFLTAVDELKGLAKDPTTGKIFCDTPAGKRELPLDTLVSMNFWGFPLSVLGDLENYFASFLEEKSGDPGAECYIPTFADHLIKKALLKVKVLAVSSDWFGVTYKADREGAVQRIAQLTEQGVYPESLWG